MREVPIAFRLSRRRAWLIALCALGSCGRAERTGREPGAAGWKVAMEPTVSVGAVGAGASMAFHQIGMAARLSDGRIVVADGGLRSRLTLLAPDGDSLGTIGRYGEGPGEYEWITSLQAGAHDSIYVFDAAQQRLTTFSGDGRVGRTATYRDAGTGMLRSVSRLADGVWFGRGLDRPLQGPVNEIVRDTISVGLLDGALSGLEPLTRLPTSMSTTLSVHGRVLFGSAPFSPRAQAATWGRCAFVSSAEDPTIDVYSATGERVAKLRIPGTRRPVSAEDVRALVQTRLDRASTREDTAIAAAFGEAPHPEYLPYINQMVVDQWGNIWLEEYSPPHGSGGQWHVVAQSGLDMGVVAMPPRLGVFEISEDGVLGATTGDFGEPLVVVLPLVARSGEGGSAMPECRSGP